MKKIIALLVTVTLLFTMVACTKTEAPVVDTDTPTDTTVNDATEASAEIKTVSMLTFTEWYKGGWDALVTYIDENAETLGFRLEVEQIAGGTEGQDLLKAKFATGDLPDLLQSFGAKWLDNNANVLDQMVALDGVDMSEYDQVQLAEGNYIYNDTLYGIPCDSASVVAMFYNKDVFKAAGVDEIPANWEEFLAACEKIKTSGTNPVYLSGADAWSLGCFTHYGFNQDVIDSGLSLTDYWSEINTNERHYTDAKNALDNVEKCKEIIDLGYVNESFLSDTYDTAQTALAEGSSAMYACVTAVYDEIATKYPEKADSIGCFALPLYDENYMCSSLPSSIGMTEGCEDKELGMKVLNFLASAEAQQVYATAQPGIYLNQNVTSDVSGCYQDAIDAMKSGGSMVLWQNVNLHHYGDVTGYIQDYLAGGMEASRIFELLDKETANNAIAAGDPNWAE